MDIEYNLNGSIVIKDGLNKKVYYGYSEREAKKLFKEEFKK